MAEIQRYEDRVYTMGEVCDIVRRGIGAEALAGWPLVSLPESVITVARVRAAEGEPLYADAVEEAQRLRPGLRTGWGVVVADLIEADPAAQTGCMLDFEAYLADDPYLELPHLRREPGETVGIFLSDLANGAIEDGPAVSAIGRLDMLGLGLTDNDRTAQLFAFYGCDLPGRNLDFAALGASLSDWLKMANVEAVLGAVRGPAVLQYVSDECGLPISRAVLQ